MQEDLILPLLDGLDEMGESARPACIVAINAYHREHPRPLVVCSRTDKYTAATRQERLALHTAVAVQSLSIQQVDTHLESLGKPLAALRRALKKNVTLQALATTPLMLQVLMLTYHGTSVRELSHKDEQLRQQIWTDYIEHMVSRKGDAKRYPLPVTTIWLSFLARQIRAHNQTIFILEQLQPDWLLKGQRILYQWSSRLVGGLLFGLGAAVQHYTLRFWLWRTYTFPLRAVPFLEDATARILLRRVSGGYSFTHRLLLDYFADLDTTSPSASTRVHPVQQSPLPEAHM